MEKKEENEITVKIQGNIKDLYAILENKNFEIVDKFSMNDYYFVPQNLQMNEISSREILSKAVIVRDFESKFLGKKRSKKLTFKEKEIDFEGNIINQNSINCDILNVEDAKKFLLAIGYKEIMNIKEDDIVYGKDGFELAIKDIKNGDNLIEVETNQENSEIDTIEKLKQKITEIEYQ